MPKTFSWLLSFHQEIVPLQTTIIHWKSNAFSNCVEKKQCPLVNVPLHNRSVFLFWLCVINFFPSSPFKFRFSNLNSINFQSCQCFYCSSYNIHTLHKTLLKHITLNKVHLKRIARYARCHNCHLFCVWCLCVCWRTMYAFLNERKFIFSLLSISVFEFGIFSRALPSSSPFLLV